LLYLEQIGLAQIAYAVPLHLRRDVHGIAVRKDDTRNFLGKGHHLADVEAPSLIASIRIFWMNLTTGAPREFERGLRVFFGLGFGQVEFYHERVVGERLQGSFGCFRKLRNRCDQPVRLDDYWRDDKPGLELPFVEVAMLYQHAGKVREVDLKHGGHSKAILHHGDSQKIWGIARRLQHARGTHARPIASRRDSQGLPRETVRA
jgi:hypothetical protein